MGGCCCCSSKDTDSAQNTYYYYPRVSEEDVPLSSNHGAASVFAGGLLVDTNLDTTIPDTYTPPPAPAPFNVTLGPNPTLPVAREICADKTNASAAGANHEASAKLEELKESAGLKVQTDLELRKLSMMQRIQNSLQNVIIISTLHAFWNGWKEVKLVLYVIRIWFWTLSFTEDMANFVQACCRL
ncbi:probable E3 ubiquitin-protein ligase RHB1A isoform X3 [Arachis stenosperma]|uniref:probable E3 ubiquitin-protein ligase RHB1A isoform X3 n=1 Tax=Arachis stenosperma TaxID=217475 RepID=UPI0025AB889B|nr:probable E3 ubiquitin-protein ligase RHB1A isoform X3 [Arachis stenosperma]